MEPEDRVQSTEYGARAELARGLVGWSMEYRGKDPKGAKVQSGAELLWKGGDQRTEYGEVALTVQKCKSADGLCKGAKVKSEDRVRSAERGRSPREAARLVRSPNPTSIHSEEGGAGTGIFASGQSRP